MINYNHNTISFVRYDHIKKNNNKTKEKTGETSNSTDGFIPMQTGIY